MQFNIASFENDIYANFEELLVFVQPENRLKFFNVFERLDRKISELREEDKEKIESLELDVEILEKNQEAMVSFSDFSELESEIESLEYTIEELKTQISDLQKQKGSHHERFKIETKKSVFSNCR